MLVTGGDIDAGNRLFLIIVRSEFSKVLSTYSLKTPGTGLATELWLIIVKNKICFTMVNRPNKPTNCTCKLADSQYYDKIPAIVLLLCMYLCYEVYYLSFHSADIAVRGYGELSLQFASDVADTTGKSHRLHLCANTILVDRWAEYTAIVTAIPILHYNEPDFIAALKLAVSIKEQLLEREWVQLLLMVEYDELADVRGEITMAKMAGWDHVCFVQPTIPAWMHARSNNAHHFMSTYALGLVGYSRVLVVPVTSLCMGDPYGILSTEVSGWWDIPNSVMYQCVPNLVSWKKATDSIQHSMQVSQPESALLSSLLHTRLSSIEAGVCVVDWDSDTTVSHVGNCTFLVYSGNSKPWSVNCLLLWWTPICRQWHNAPTRDIQQP
jgi:hypothetical protein